MLEEYQKVLEEYGAIHVSTFIDKLRDNSINREVFDDLLFEGRAALMFLVNGFSIEMRESPDLKLEFAGHQLYADVKHFRMKEQDKIDEANMEAAEDELVPYGDTVPLEGIPAWDQIVNVAKHKAKQYLDGGPNILVIGSSSSNCIDDLIVPTAINIIAEEVCNGRCPGLDKLNGILLMNSDFNCSQGRNVCFFHTHTSKFSIAPIVLAALDSIRTG